MQCTSPSASRDRRFSWRGFYVRAPWVAWMICCGLFIVGASPASGDDHGTGQTRVFGVPGRGSRFVYVFDRSLSMKGSALAAAKRELLASLANLERVYQFQIIFYNQSPRLMRPEPNQPPQMVFADENGLAQATSFVASITADGATDHVQALNLALRMHPDVIFFLTDADEPQLSPKELEQIRRNNGGTTINAIEFKSGPDRGKGDFLRKLAEQNGGQYRYVDVMQLPAER